MHTIMNKAIHAENKYKEALDEFRACIISAIKEIPVVATGAKEISKNPPCAIIKSSNLTDSLSASEYLYEEHINNIIKMITTSPTPTKIIETISLLVDHKSYLLKGKTIRLPSDLAFQIKEKCNIIVQMHKNQ